MQALALLLAPLLQAGAPPSMDIVLERRTSGAWLAVDPALVLSQGDRVRFRLRANFDSWLYVMNRGTSGSYLTLFPREDTGRQNRIQALKEYVIPATDGAFRIEGPPGQDVVYWVASPAELPVLPPSPPRVAPLPSLTPRCDDIVLRARGDCVDNSAGPKLVREGEKLPENLERVLAGTSRELRFMREGDRTIISTPVRLEGPVIYEFRLSHR